MAAIPVCAAESGSWSDGDEGFGYHENKSAEVINGQLNLGDVWSQIDTSIKHVDGDVGSANVAVGNTAEVFTFSDTSVENDQASWGAIGAKTNAKVRGVGGDVTFTATSLCNGLTVSTDPRVTAVNSKQVCGSADPSARVNANISHVAGGVGIQTTAVGNQIEVDSNAAKFPVTSSQVNHGSVISGVNARIRHVGSAAVSATAAGNTAQIIQY